MGSHLSGAGGVLREEPSGSLTQVQRRNSRIPSNHSSASLIGDKAIVMKKNGNVKERALKEFDGAALLKKVDLSKVVKL